jgi:hypothetical protein
MGLVVLLVVCNCLCFWLFAISCPCLDACKAWEWFLRSCLWKHEMQHEVETAWGVAVMRTEIITSLFDVYNMSCINTHILIKMFSYIMNFVSKLHFSPVKFYPFSKYSGEVMSGEVLSSEVMSGEVLSGEVLSWTQTDYVCLWIDLKISSRYLIADCGDISIFHLRGFILELSWTHHKMWHINWRHPDAIFCFWIVFVIPSMLHRYKSKLWHIVPYLKHTEIKNYNFYVILFFITYHTEGLISFLFHCFYCINVFWQWIMNSHYNKMAKQVFG